MKKLREHIPEFNFDDLSEEEPIIVFSFLCDFIKELIRENNQSLIERIVKFINLISENDDVNIMGLVDELALSIYDDKPTYEVIKGKLSAKAKIKFDSNINNWKAGNMSVH